MSYNIIKTDGTPLATVADGQTNSTASSLTLIGKNYAGYGTFLNENFVKLLENFSSATAPLYPLKGQLWWKSDSRWLQVYDNGNWKTISGAQSQSDSPTNPVAGDLWFDTVNQQLKTYSGANWVVIGPSFTSTTGTSGAIADTVVDSGLYSHVVVKFFVQNNLIAILSKDAAFTPSTTIPGFSSIKPGFNLATDRSPALVYYDNANNASYLGGIASNKYITSTTPTVTAKMVIQSPEGLEISEAGGSPVYFDLNVTSNNVNLIGLARGNGLKIQTTPDNAGGRQVDALTVSKTTGLITVYQDPTDVLGVATKGYVDTLDTGTRSLLASSSATINATITTLTANTTSVYGNVRILQSDLGIVGGPLSSFGNATPWKQLVIDSGQSLSANIMALWANLASVHYQTLSAPGNPPAQNASLLSNVKTLQGTVSAIGTDFLKKNGDIAITGVLAPAVTDNTDFGAAGARFKISYATTANVHNITKGGTTGVGDIGSDAQRFGTIYCASIDTVGATGALTIPVGTTVNRPGSAVTGMIRFNTTIHSFEGYNDSVPGSWQSLGGVKSVDGFTYIIAESAPGDSNGELEFYVEQANGTSTAKAAGLNKDRLLVSSGVKLQTNYITTGLTATTGTIVGAWTLDTGSKLQATYADLAERFAADAVLSEGTVVALGGEHEITQENNSTSDDVFGVVSRKYAYLMNEGAGPDETHPAIAMIGRVPVRVVGAVAKGNRLVSAGNGCARAAAAGEATAFNVIGRALENKQTEQEGLVMSVVSIR